MDQNRLKTHVRCTNIESSPRDLYKNFAQSAPITKAGYNYAQA